MFGYSCMIPPQGGRRDRIVTHGGKGQFPLDRFPLRSIRRVPTIPRTIG